MAKDKYEFEDEDFPPAEKALVRRSPPKDRSGKRKATSNSADKRKEAAKSAVKSKRAETITLIVIAAVLIPFIAFMVIRENMQKTAEMDALRTAIKEFLIEPVEAPPGEPTPRVGKVVLIDAQKGEVDGLHQSIPEHLRAITPADATTIARMEHSRKVVGEYSHGAKAVHRSAIMTLVDRSTGIIISKRPFDWGDPPKSVPTSWGGDITGEMPVKEIESFLTALR